MITVRLALTSNDRGAWEEDRSRTSLPSPTCASYFYSRVRDGIKLTRARGRAVTESYTFLPGNSIYIFLRSLANSEYRVFRAWRTPIVKKKNKKNWNLFEYWIALPKSLLNRS